MLRLQQWIDPYSPFPQDLACWYCKDHKATVAFWETAPSGMDMAHGAQPTPACACCCNRKGIEYAKALIAQQQARIPVLEAELAKDCREMEVR